MRIPTVSGIGPRESIIEANIQGNHIILLKKFAPEVLFNINIGISLYKVVNGT